MSHVSSSISPIKGVRESFSFFYQVIFNTFGQNRFHLWNNFGFLVKNRSITTSISSLKFHYWNKVISSNVVLHHNIYRSKLDNVSSRDFLCFILNVVLCICNCHLKAFSELEVTDTRNVIFRILVPFPGPTSNNCYSQLLWKGFSYLSSYRYHNTFFRFLLSTTWILPSKLERNASFFSRAVIPNPLSCIVCHNASQSRISSRASARSSQQEQAWEREKQKVAL